MSKGKILRNLLPDPVFPMMFLVNSWIPGMLDAIAQATFLSALLLFWLCVYHGLRQVLVPKFFLFFLSSKCLLLFQNERKLLTFYVPKLFIVGMLWLSAIVLATWQRYNELQDPTYNHTIDTTHYQGFKMFFFTFCGIYLAYLLLLILRAYSELRSMPFFGKIQKRSKKIDVKFFDFRYETEIFNPFDVGGVVNKPCSDCTKVWCWGT